MLGILENLRSCCMYTILETCVQSFNKHFLGIYYISGTCLKAWIKRWNELLVRSEQPHLSLLSPRTPRKGSRGICFLMERRRWLMRYVNRILEETEPIAMRSLIRVSASSVLLSASRGENHWTNGDLCHRNRRRLRNGGHQGLRGEKQDGTRKRGACRKLAKGSKRCQGLSCNLLSLVTSLPQPARGGGSLFLGNYTRDSLDSDTVEGETQLREVGRGGATFRKQMDWVKICIPDRVPSLLPHQGSQEEQQTGYYTPRHIPLWENPTFPEKRSICTDF